MVLVPCPACQRHVASSETACPFCAADIPADLARGAVPAATGRLTRAAIYTFAASVTVAACSTGGVSDPVADGGIAKNDGSAGDSGNVQPVYGAPVDGGTLFDSGGGDSGSDDDGAVGTLYGAPAFDSGTD